MKTRTRRLLTAVLAVCLFLLLAFSSLLIVTRRLNCLPEDQTAEFTAVIAEAEISRTAKSLYVNLRTAEPERTLYIRSAVSSRSDPDRIRSLRPGDVITCRTDNRSAAQADASQPSEIVALTIGGDPIFTLAERNAVMQAAAAPAHTAVCVLIGLLACTASCCIAALRRSRTQQ